MRLPRYTIRLRLTVLYGGVFLILGAILLTIAYAGGSASFSRRSVVQAVSGTVVKPGSEPTPTTPSGEPEEPTSLSVTPQSQQEEKLGAIAVNVHGSDQHRMLIWSGLALAIMAVISMVLGWLLAGRSLRPLQTITAAARRISASSLHERLALAGPHDELRELGDTFDELLGRLESSFDAQRQFVANASHELRTPLTLERAILDVTLADPAAGTASLRSACERVLAIGEQQEHMIDALLTLARSERGVEHCEPLLLDELTREILREHDDEIARRGLRLESKLQPAPVAGDRRLIERLVANLLDNAIRHNNHDGWVTVASAIEAGDAVLTASNSGSVIAPEQLPSLVRPFQRLGAERTSHDGGHGLGLSIVDAIATAHGATLAVHAQPAGGLRVEVRFPKPDASPAGHAA
ncbi:MAG TPA: HAMP domain-containing sensor histidine kinase [Solirubrobacteraceae bacterium]|jgi:signal transduction histidine kinase|nr:HAMP domain-containing sensor histidine kinase [Solirubrobacteraceae bacterium]